MQYVYFLDNQGPEDRRSNSPVFKLIQELEIPEWQIYNDSDPDDRVELKKLVRLLDAGDTLNIRSVIDCVCSIDELLEMFDLFSDIGVQLHSVEEPFLSGINYKEIIQGVVVLLNNFRDRSRKESYRQAVIEGRVGRPAKIEQVRAAIELYYTNDFSLAQIERLTGVSKTTIYKYLKDYKNC